MHLISHKSHLYHIESYPLNIMGYFVFSNSYSVTYCMLHIEDFHKFSSKRNDVFTKPLVALYVFNNTN